MRFEELAYRDGGQAVTIPFHRTLTVLGGLDAELRRRFADRAVAAPCAGLWSAFSHPDDAIRPADQHAARRRYDAAARAVARLEAELAVLRGAEPAERRVAEAAVVAVRLAADHHAATAALDEAKAA